MTAEMEPPAHASELHELHEPLVGAMRTEAQEYGELLALFDEQQAAVINRAPDAVLEIDGRITAQLTILRGCRKTREALVADLARRTEPPLAESVTEVMALFREPVRPLVQALMAEINALIGKARRRAQQNRMLLARSVEVAQELLEKLNPAVVSRTYSPQGKMKIKAAGGSSRLLDHS